MFIKVLACRGFEQRLVAAALPGQPPVKVKSPIGLVEYQGPGFVLAGKHVVIDSVEAPYFPADRDQNFDLGRKRDVTQRRIPMTHVVRMEVVS